MKKLIITANPSSQGFTHTITHTLQELSLKQQDEVEILNLYTTPLQQTFLNYEQQKNIGQDTITQQIQQKLLRAEEYIFIFPIWRGDMPAIMKNFWDCNFTQGFAYQYKKGGKKEGLLKWKQARIIATSGSPAYIYKRLLHIQLLWKFNRINFCGIKQKSFTIFWNLGRTKTKKEKYLQKIKKLVSN